MSAGDNDLSVVIREIYSQDDPSFLPLMELYVESFPRDEREPIASFARRVSPLADNRRSTNCRSHLLAVEDGEQVIGMRQCHFDPASGLGFFVYIAIDQRYRMRGLGTRLLDFSRALLELDAMGTSTQCRAILFECERVCDATTEADRVFRQDRLKYFAKRGGRVVSGTYVQPPNAPGLQPVPLNLMAYPGSQDLDKPELVRGFYDVFFGVAPDDPLVLHALDGVHDTNPR